MSSPQVFEVHLESTIGRTSVLPESIHSTSGMQWQQLFFSSKNSVDIIVELITFSRVNAF